MFHVQTPIARLLIFTFYIFGPLPSFSDLIFRLLASGFWILTWFPDLRPMRHSFIDGEFEYEYFVFGNGPTVLFTFHGFDNDAGDFEPLAKVIGHKYTIVSLNLLFHGTSTTNEKVVERGMSTEEFLRGIKKLMEFFPAEKYELLGFSLGGRMVLYLVSRLGAKISRFSLLAPDGLKSSAFYRFATGSKIGHGIFKRITDNPGRFFNIAKAFEKIGLIPEKKLRFARYSLETPAKRSKVYNSWMVYRHILPDTDKVKNEIRKNDIRAELFFGKFDVLMRPELGKSFRNGIEKQARLHVLETGHQLIKGAVLEQIGKSLIERIEY